MLVHMQEINFSAATLRDGFTFRKNFAARFGLLIEIQGILLKIRVRWHNVLMLATHGLSQVIPCINLVGGLHG